MNESPSPDNLMTTSEAVRVPGMPPDMVRWLVREGRYEAQQARRERARQLLLSLRAMRPEEEDSKAEGGGHR